MTKVNTHGLKMVGLKKVAGESRCLPDDGLGWLQVNYDKYTGKVWSDFFYGLNDWWTEYHDEDIVFICKVRGKITMQELADEIYNYLNYLKENEYYE